MTSHCSTCTCHDSGEAFALRPATSSRWAIDQAKQAADEAVKRAKEKRIAEAKAAAAKDREDRGRC